MTIRPLVSVALAIAICLTPVAASQTARVDLNGTFSSMHYHEEAGDLLGYELLIVPSFGGGYRGLLQEAEGGLPRIHFVSVFADFDGNISFAFLDFDGSNVRCVGKISADWLDLKFTFAGGVTQEVRLKRQTSYWDR